MTDRDELQTKLIALIVSLSKELDEDGQLELDTPLTGNSPLFGADGALDSLGLVTLIVAVEQSIESDFDVGVALADEKALSQTQSPYRTVKSLAAYAAAAVRGAGSGD